MLKLSPTVGTRVASWTNLAVGIFAALDQAGVINALPPQYGIWATVLVSTANAALHAMTGNVPMVGTTVPGTIKA